MTRHGQAMAELPTHPRIAHLLLRGQALGLTTLAEGLKVPPPLQVPPAAFSTEPVNCTVALLAHTDRLAPASTMGDGAMVITT